MYLFFTTWSPIEMIKITALCLNEDIANSYSDGGLPASKFFARVHPKLGLPLNALILTTVVVIIFGLIFLGSSR
jgi:amino acid transporter